MNRVAGRQHRVIHVDQLHEIGLSDRMIALRVRSGRLHRRHRGVYVVGPGELSPEGSCLAAVLAVGRDAVLDDMAAGYVWGFWKRVTEPVHVAVPRRVRSRPGICVRVLHQPQASRAAGIPIVSPAYALRSMADTLYSDREDAEAHEAETAGYVARALSAARPRSSRAAGAR